MRLGRERREALSRQIQERILAHPWYREARFLLVYAAFGDEADTALLMERALSEGREVFCPRTFREGRMEFYRVTDPSCLSPNVLGIPEPPEEEEKRFDPALFQKEGRREDCLVILPGLAFDRAGNRAGYGGGFYDRYLERLSLRRLLAPAFSVQIFPLVPREDHDIPADLVLTEDSVFRLME